MPEDQAGSGPPKPAGRCPICQRAADPDSKPFCSKRCADVDLHRWIVGRYRASTEDEPDDNDDAGSGDHRND
ncbi:DNA gyrase inhibitor YacG [Lichenihabitans sp. Uapishka_5]|uniref:DNA gyrase inhibitor YacG n=1 Tax=Lichenihabitans sp. Uapishka_5 TaxID=3037302 RepID=UPI0029E7EE6A|nr:DNA gyrase inhibitor YacG [Lichenihabitans sp. Uapishka_5]MDX7951116.1 DNA gyrase inhibitor YacG [Lichenihabitans sp. Uapishka_5]